ncbi:MAG: hypothetical protein OXG91_09935 [bacterium]|nr:hypothetical protein [bacterium]
MERHPGIVFRIGSAGRRAGLAGGSDVWEVVQACLGDDADGPLTPAAVAEQMGLTADQVGVAFRYAEFRDEIDARIRMVVEDAERAEAAWRTERELLGR